MVPSFSAHLLSSFATFRLPQKYYFPLSSFWGPLLFIVAADLGLNEFSVISSNGKHLWSYLLNYDSYEDNYTQNFYFPDDNHLIVSSFAGYAAKYTLEGQLVWEFDSETELLAEFGDSKNNANAVLIGYQENQVYGITENGETAWLFDLKDMGDVRRWVSKLPISQIMFF